NILDIFAGTGAMGLEALSRSHLEEAHCVFVDSDPKAAEVIRKNIGTCKEEDRSEVLTADALKAISILANDKRTFELVVMDAPYNNEELTSKVLLALSKSSILSSEALIICETSLEVELQETQGLQLLKEKAYGDTKVSFFLKDKD
ncbi:MAG: RsmD family RNA methyltransferase, partial [Deltaproteobacteria bacterium]|nr:RsmD family RNA methyltransferase [Deltaproteobacteria bacterium]